MNSLNEMLNQEDLAILQSQEEKLLREETRCNPGRMGELLAADFREFGRSGRTYTLKDILSVEECSFQCKFPLADFTITGIAPDVALVTYHSEIIYGGETLYARRSSLWSRREGRWVLRFHQGTPYDPNG
jgi:hypothetical protein